MWSQHITTTPSALLRTCHQSFSFQVATVTVCLDLSGAGTMGFHVPWNEGSGFEIVTLDNSFWNSSRGHTTAQGTYFTNVVLIAFCVVHTWIHNPGRPTQQLRPQLKGQMLSCMVLWDHWERYLFWVFAWSHKIMNTQPWKPQTNSRTNNQKLLRQR